MTHTYDFTFTGAGISITDGVIVENSNGGIVSSLTGVVTWPSNPSGAGSLILDILGNSSLTYASPSSFNGGLFGTAPSGDVIAIVLSPGAGNSLVDDNTDLTVVYGAAAVYEVTTNQLLPVISAPAGATVEQGQATAISGVSLSEANNLAGETFTVTLTDARGDLSATGSGVSGDGTTSLTITGSLTQVNSDLATLTDTDAATSSDTITLNASDSFGNNASPQTIAVTVLATPPTPTAAPPISEFPTYLLSQQSNGFYSLLPQQTSQNLASYLGSDTIITNEELSYVSSTPSSELNAFDNALSTVDEAVTNLSDTLTIQNPDIPGLAELEASELLATPAAESFLGAQLDEDGQLVVSGISVFASFVVAEAQFGLDPIADLGFFLAAVHLELEVQKDVTSAAIANDPPDPNYQQVFVPAPIVAEALPATGLPTALVTAAQAALTDIDQATQWMYSVDVTENRYATALAAGATNAASMQFVAFLNYLGLYMSAAQAASTDLNDLSNQLQANNIGTQVVTAQQLTTALDTAQTQGTSGVSGVLESLGFTDTEIQTMEQEVQAETIPSSEPSETAVQELNYLAASFYHTSVPSDSFTVGSSQTLNVSSGQTSIGIVVQSGGTLNVSGTAVSVLDAGTENVSGADVDATINSGGNQYVSNGGNAVRASVSDGGCQYVESGGTSTDTVLGDPGIQVVSAGGTATDTTVSGGEQDVYGTASGTTISAGTVTVYDGGSLQGTIVDSGTLIFDLTGSYAFTGTLTGNGSVVVEGGGSVITSSGITFASYADSVSTYDIGGDLVSQTINNINGTHWVNAYDPAATASWIWSTSAYDANGNLTSQTGMNQDGTHWLTMYDVNNSYSWSSATINFDANWNWTSVTGTNGNASFSMSPSKVAAAFDTLSWYTTPFDPNASSAVPTVLTAGSGNDVLVGNAGNDTLIAGTGNDILYGNGGNNTFVFDSGSGQDQIMDFQPSQDTLQFSLSLLTNYTAAMTDAKQVGANTVFTLGANDSVTLQNVNMNSLTASNFHFS